MTLETLLTYFVKAWVFSGVFLMGIVFLAVLLFAVVMICFIVNSVGGWRKFFQLLSEDK